MVVITLNLDIIINSVEMRCYTYDWLRQIYLAEPSMEMIQELIRMAKNYDDLEESSIETDLIIFLRGLTGEDLKHLNVELKAEFARLFLGPNKLLAPPFESVYLSPRKRMMGEETMEVREMYKEMEIEVSAFGSMPDDHIGLELEFMYYLCFKTIGLIRDKESIVGIIKLVEMQQKFISEHLIKWIPLFCKDIKDNTNLLFFKEMADFTERFIFEEKEIIEHTLNSFKDYK